MKHNHYKLALVFLVIVEILVILGYILGAFFLQGIDDSGKNIGMSDDIVAWIVIGIIGLGICILYRKVSDTKQRK